jgi:hypothetical protein
MILFYNLLHDQGVTTVNKPVVTVTEISFHKTSHIQFTFVKGHEDVTFEQYVFITLKKMRRVGKSGKVI